MQEIKNTREIGQQWWSIEILEYDAWKYLAVVSEMPAGCVKKVYP